MGRLGKQRKRLWEKDPHCHWCGRLTRLLDLGCQGSHQPDDMATIDHLNSRFSKDRHAPCNGEIRRVIACYRCNHDRGAEEQAGIPVDELQRRARQHERKKVNKLIHSNGMKLDWMSFMKDLEGLSFEDRVKKVDDTYRDCFIKVDSIEASIEDHDIGDLGFLIKAEAALRRCRRHLQFLQKLKCDLGKQERVRQTEEENKRFERLFMWKAKEMLPVETYNAILDATKCGIGL